MDESSAFCVLGNSIFDHTLWSNNVENKTNLHIPGFMIIKPGYAMLSLSTIETVDCSLCYARDTHFEKPSYLSNVA